MTIYPRGIKTTNKIGEVLKCSGALILKWRKESAFQALVQDLEIRFVTHVLTNLKDKTFFDTLYHESYWEPYAWGDIAGQIFYLELMNFLNIDKILGKPQDKLRKQLSYARQLSLSELNYKPSSIDLPLSDNPYFFDIYQTLAFDLARSAGEASLSRRKIRGKKPYAKARLRVPEALRADIRRNPREWLTLYLENLEEFITADRPKEEILMWVKAIKQSINILYPQKAGMDRDEGTPV